MDRASLLRLVTENAELSEAIEQKIRDCVDETKITTDDLTALSHDLQALTAIFTSVQSLLRHPRFSRLPGGSQAQHDARATLDQVLGRCRAFSKDLHPVFAGVEKLRGKRVLAEAALRGFVTAKAGLRVFRSRLQILCEHISAALAAVTVHIFMKCPDERPLHGEVQKLVVFRQKTVRYSVDDQETISLHMFVAKTLLAVKIYRVAGSRIDENVNAATREVIEAWVTPPHVDDDDDMQNLATGCFGMETDLHNDFVGGNDRETGITASFLLPMESHGSANSTSSVVSPANIIQDQSKNVPPEHIFIGSLVPEVQSADTLPLSYSNMPISSLPATKDQHTADIPLASKPTTYPTKLSKNLPSAHRRIPFTVWMKKWYKPR